MTQSTRPLLPTQAVDAALAVFHGLGIRLTDDQTTKILELHYMLWTSGPSVTVAMIESVRFKIQLSLIESIVEAIRNPKP